MFAFNDFLPHRSGLALVSPFLLAVTTTLYWAMLEYLQRKSLLASVNKVFDHF